MHAWGVILTSLDLQFDLEESQLEMRESPGGIRDDLVYIPYVDGERDADLLASDNMPDHFLEQIRFERSAATKFLTALQRGLKK